MKIVSNEETFEVDVKRFYLPGVSLEGKCPKCDGTVVEDFSRENYLSYPMANEVFEHGLYCEHCAHEWTVKLRLVLKLDLVEEAPPVKSTAREVEPSPTTDALVHHQVALIHGYDILARKSKTFAERSYYYLGRELAMQEFKRLGGKGDLTAEHVVLEMPAGPVSIRFLERDIEAMRQAVADWDAKKSAEGASG